MNSIAIICPVFNRKSITVNFLSKLQSISSNNFNFDVIIIDDGSPDHTGKIIEKIFKHVKVIYGDGRLWWSGAVNVGIRYSIINKYDYVYIINDDVKFFKDTLDNLYRLSKIHRNSIISSIITYNGNIISAGYKKCRFFNIYKPQYIRRSIHSIDRTIVKADTISSMSTLIPTKFFKYMGYFDEKKFPHHYSDIDYFSKAEKFGIKLLISSKSIIESEGSGSNFHRMLISNSIIFIFCSFFQRKFGNNLNVIIKSSFYNSNFLIGYLTFFVKIFPYLFWMLIRIFFTSKSLTRLLYRTKRIEL